LLIAQFWPPLIRMSVSPRSPGDIAIARPAPHPPTSSRTRTVAWGRRQIACLVGVAPIKRDSGTFRSRRMVLGGRASVRRALYLPILTAIRCNPAIRVLYARLIARGKPAKVAITVAMRKLLTILNAILKSPTPWQHA
jgi:transposase